MAVSSKSLYSEASTECSSCKRRSDGLCAECAPHVLDAISRYKTGDVHLRAGEDLFGIGEAGDLIFNIAEGWAFLYNILGNGDRQILHFALPGAVVGFHPTQGALTTFGAQAVTDLTACVIPMAGLKDIARKHPEVALRLAWLTSRDRSLAYDHLTSVGQQTAQERVAHLILELFIRARLQWPGHRTDEMHLPLTQEHIGDATGLTGVHVNRVLRNLREEGIIEFHYRRLKIIDPDALVDVAGIDPQLAYSWSQKSPFE